MDGGQHSPSRSCPAASCSLHDPPSTATIAPTPLLPGQTPAHSSAWIQARPSSTMTASADATATCQPAGGSGWGRRRGGATFLLATAPQACSLVSGSRRPELCAAGPPLRGHMKALVYHGPGNKAWEDVADATIQEPTDVVVRVGTTTICGTDLHILQGDVAAVTEGRILGHEAVGPVTEVGGAVRGFKPGDRVLIPGRLPLGPVRWSPTSHAARRTGRAARGDDQGQKQASCLSASLRWPLCIKKLRGRALEGDYWGLRRRPGGTSLGAAGHRARAGSGRRPSVSGAG